MKRVITWILWMATLIGLVWIGVRYFTEDSSQSLATKPPLWEESASPATKPLAIEEPTASDTELLPEPEETVIVTEEVREKPVPPTPPKPTAQIPNATKPKKPSSKPPLADPDARIALAGVGVDSDAEKYWVSAINNPNIPPEERKDLIEDLNEDGFSNPNHPGPEDLPLIKNRIMLIEQLLPDAMDQTNAEAFLEAYKDLQKMYNRLQEQ